MTKLEQLRAELDAWRLGEVKVAAVLNRSLRNVAPQLLALWEACEAERAAVCDGSCDEGRHDFACPINEARAAVAAVLERGLP